MFVFDMLIPCDEEPVFGAVVTDVCEEVTAGESCADEFCVGEFLKVLALCIGDSCLGCIDPEIIVSRGVLGVDDPAVPYKDVGALDVGTPEVE